MRNRIISGAILLVALLAFTAHLFPVCAQTTQEPVREELLNGLKVFVWSQPGNANVVLKVRIRSGAAFDLTDKAGMMALLGDAFFPDPETVEYVSDQLGGKLEVSTNYDSINVTMSGKASEFERMVDLLRGALVTTQLTPDIVNKLREQRARKLSSQQS